VTAALGPLGAPSLIPLLVLAGTTIGILLCDLWNIPWRLAAWVSLTSQVIAAVLALIVMVSGQGRVVQGLLRADGISALFTLFFCSVGTAAAFLGLGSGRDVPSQDVGSYALALLAICGALIVAQAAHMLSLAIGLAVVYVTTSALVGPSMARQHTIAQGVSVACVALGLTLLYGAAGTLDLGPLANQPTDQATNTLAALGRGLLLGGLIAPLATAISAPQDRKAPWEADLQGQYLVSLVLPGTACAALGRLQPIWTDQDLLILTIVGALSIGLGNLIAVRPVASAREILLGVTFAQSGTFCLALAAIPQTGWQVLFYVILASGMSLTSLWALVVCARRGRAYPSNLGDLIGLGRHHPWLAGATTLCLLSLGGVPPLAGGMGTLALLRAVVSAERGWALAPAIPGILMVWLLIGRWSQVMWKKLPPDLEWRPAPPEAVAVALIAAGGTVFAGIWAYASMDWIASLAAVP
jgi:NADH-quinone oxidoreductase subunit N